MEEEPMKVRNVRYVPEECHDIFSKHPRDLPGYPRETHWYFYCRKLSSRVTSHSIWKQTGEETDVLDPKNNDALVGIKRPFTLLDHEEESGDILLSDEDEPSQHNWFMDEISLPLTVSETDWILCHVFPKIKP
ncbi:NAC (No Apical Meristem) domain transcriptional regulator superfamily protein [Raphanus sativus]|nr:NAC (No Apical Meristem) domain transcriptional regulator superfamily protein [Raphanus sativus]